MWDKVVKTADKGVAEMSKNNFPNNRQVIGDAIVEYMLLMLEVLWPPEARAVIGGKGHRR